MRCTILCTVALIFILPHIVFSQTERWVYTYSGITGWESDVCNVIYYGSDGNIYAAGTGCHVGTADDILAVSLSTNGTEQWVYIYNGFADFGDYANALVCDAHDNIYVGGSSFNSDTISDFTIISLTSEGTERWIYRHQGSYIGNGCVRALTYGADDNVYAAGYDERIQSGRDFVVVSLDTSGTERWLYRYNGPGNNSDDAYSIAYGVDGNIYVAGVYDYNSAVVISLTNTGVERWVYHYDVHYEDGAYRVLSGADGNVYAFGTCAVYGPYVFAFAFAISLSDSGTENWTYVHQMPSSATSGAFGGNGRIYIAGACGSDIPVFMVIGVDNSGSLEWEYLHGLATAWATSIIFGPDNNIYAAGCSVDSMTGYYLAVVSLYTSGTERWTYEYGGPDFCMANDLCYGADSNLYVGGVSVDSVTGNDFTVISLNPIPIAIDDSVSNQFPTVLHIHPNPFRQDTEIRCQTTGNSTIVDIEIFDVAGRLVNDLSKLSSIVGHQLSVRWDGTDAYGNKLPSGVYFLKFRAGDHSTTEKLLLMR